MIYRPVKTKEFKQQQEHASFVVSKSRKADINHLRFRTVGVQCFCTGDLLFTLHSTGCNTTSAPDDLVSTHLSHPWTDRTETARRVTLTGGCTLGGVYNLLFARMPCGVTVGDSGPCCCVPCLLSAIISLCLLILHRRFRPNLSPVHELIEKIKTHNRLEKNVFSVSAGFIRTNGTYKWKSTFAVCKVTTLMTKLMVIALTS